MSPDRAGGGEKEPDEWRFDQIEANRSYPVREPTIEEELEFYDFYLECGWPKIRQLEKLKREEEAKAKAGIVNDNPDHAEQEPTTRRTLRSRVSRAVGSLLRLTNRG